MHSADKKADDRRCKKCPTKLLEIAREYLEENPAAIEAHIESASTLRKKESTDDDDTNESLSRLQGTLRNVLLGHVECTEPTLDEDGDFVCPTDSIARHAILSALQSMSEPTEEAMQEFMNSPMAQLMQGVPPMLPMPAVAASSNGSEIPQTGQYL